MSVVLVIVALVAFTNAGEACGPFEISTDQYASCQPTCDNPNRTLCPTEGCEDGCICKDGYIRETEGGKCIPKEECLTCGLNEQVTISGFDCITCENRRYVKCALFNETKCRCAQGYIRSENGTCITEEECQLNEDCSDTYPNTQYYPCIPCPEVCPGQLEIVCSSNICMTGCGCKDGYVTDMNNGRCVLRENCPGCHD